MSIAFSCEGLTHRFPHRGGGDLVTLQQVTPQGHELLGEFLVRHAEGRITVRALRDTLVTKERVTVDLAMVERAREVLPNVSGPDMLRALEAALNP